MAETPPTFPTSHQTILCKHTTLLPGTPTELNIQNTRFIFVNDTTLLYNGKSIQVVIHYFSNKSLCVEFVDILALRKIIGPNHFIQLNKIYVFDINLDVDDLDHLYFSTKSMDEVRDELEEFIETNGKIVERGEDNDWFMVRSDNNAFVIFTILEMDVENGYIVELSTGLKHEPYHKNYKKYAAIFDARFNPPLIHDDSYKQLVSF